MEAVAVYKNYQIPTIENNWLAMKRNDYKGTHKKETCLRVL